jgi:hypothetical protein
VDVAAFRAPQGPVLEAGTRRDSALDCHAGLASGTARTLGGARRQCGRRRLQIGHGIDPGKVTNGDYLNRIQALGFPRPRAGPSLFEESAFVLKAALHPEQAT